METPPYHAEGLCQERDALGMWTPEALLQRQTQRRNGPTSAVVEPKTVTFSWRFGDTKSPSSPSTVAPASSAIVVPPLRSDQIRRLNVYLQTAAAGTERNAESSSPHVDIPDPTDALALARRDDLTLALLESVGCHMPQLIAGNVPLTTLRKLGCDGLHLSARPVVTAQLVARFGAASVAASALATPTDAIALAGSTAATQLGLTPRLMLQTLATPAPMHPNMPTVSDMALCILDHEMTRSAALFAERQRQTGSQATVPSSVALFQCLNVGDLAAVGLEASVLVRRYRIDVHTLAQALGAFTLRELAPLGVVVVV